MKIAIFLASFLTCASILGADSGTLERIPLMVDQDKNLNAEGIASVEDVATNAVRVQIAEAKAEAVQATAQVVTNSVQAVVDNIMSNNVVVYRKGFSDSFAAYVVFTDSDRLIITDVVFSRSGSDLLVNLEYVCTADIGALKPTVMHHSTLTGGRSNFEQLADSAVATPVFHSGSQTISNETTGEEFTVSGYYTTTVTVAGAGASNQYFIWIKVEADTPSGDGMTIDLVNGVVGGKSVTVNWGGYKLTFVGGILKEVADE